ncbi:hypothetical protein AAE121_005312, partial [Salmonella enterica]
MEAPFLGSDVKTIAAFSGCLYERSGKLSVSFSNDPGSIVGDWRPLASATPSVASSLKPSLGPSGSGKGSGVGGFGNGSGAGVSSGNSSGTGVGSGKGSGSGVSSGNSSGTGGGYGNGSGAVVSSGNSSGTGVGSGNGSGTGVSSGNSSGTGDAGSFDVPGSVVSVPVSGGKPGETVHIFPSPPPVYTPPGEVSEAELFSYMKEFFIYNKECGSSCLDYFDIHRPIPKPFSCEDLAFNLNVPHKKPVCGSDDIAWYDKDGHFIQFKYGLSDKTHHDFINKLKRDFFHSDSFYPGVTPLPSGSLPVEVTNSFPNPFNTPLRLSSRFDNYHNKDRLHNEFDFSSFSTRSDDGWLIPLSRYDGISPFDILSLMDGRLELIAGSADSNYFNSIELKSFHSDYNKGHSELMDYLNKKPSTPDYGGMENEFSSVVGNEMGKVTDSV